MTSRVDEPVAVVTGGAGGIGTAVVQELAADGYRVVSVIRRPSTYPAGGVTYLVADVSESGAMDAAATKTLSLFGRIDVLVTTAAVLRSAPLHETTESMWDEVIDTNLKGVFLSCRAVLPAMIAAGSGSIINLSSVHAVATMRGTGAYAATKGAIISLSRQMAVEYADDGIRVNSLVVGSVDTPMTDLHKGLLERDGIEVHPPAGRIGRMGRPEEIAKAVKFLAGDDSSFVTGSSIAIDGGLLSVLL